jgi:hypothetical protein
MTTPTTKEMTLPELRRFDGQLFIMNKTMNKVTFHEKMGENSVDFELDPAGEPDSIAFLPRLALDMRGLQKLWMKGSVAISTDPDMEGQIMLLNAQSVGASEARMREIMGLQTESANVRDITEAMCLVCGKRNAQTNVVERGRVLQSRRQVKDGEPPLCPEHADQARNYVPRLVSEKGEEHWEFDTVQMTQTQR